MIHTHIAAWARKTCGKLCLAQLKGHADWQVKSQKSIHDTDLDGCRSLMLWLVLRRQPAQASPTAAWPSRRLHALQRPSAWQP